MANDVFLKLTGIRKSFGGVHALNGVDLTIRKGEIHCLAGENGCGKSTLIKAISGVHDVDSGTIEIDGEPVSHMRPIDAINRGIQVIYQDFAVFPNMTVAENIALQLENRISFRRAMKSTMQRTLRAGAKGVKTSVAGRLGGADIARKETYSEGTIPLQTLRADIDYGFAEADTQYGKVGVKAWVYNGEVLPTKSAGEGSEQ